MKEVKLIVSETGWQKDIPADIMRRSVESLIPYIKKRTEFGFTFYSGVLRKSINKIKELKLIDNSNYKITGEIVCTFVDSFRHFFLIDCGLVIRTYSYKKINAEVGDYVSAESCIYGDWDDWASPTLKCKVKDVILDNKGFLVTLTDIKSLPIIMEKGPFKDICIKQNLPYEINFVQGKMTFEEFLKRMDIIPASGSPLLMYLPDKKFLPLIEKAMFEDIKHNVLTNLFHVLVNTKNKVSDKIIERICKEIINKDSSKVGSLYALCGYMLWNKKARKKYYCGLLKKLLEKFGTEKMLLGTYTTLVPVLRAVEELNCVGCYQNVNEIASYGTRLNPWVMHSADEALKKLRKSKKFRTTKDFMFHFDSEKEMEEIKKSLTKELGAENVSRHSCNLEGNRIEIWNNKGYVPESKDEIDYKFDIYVICMNLANTLSHQRKLAKKLEKFFKKIGKTYLVSELFMD